MKLKLFLDTPPWEWPRDAGKTFRAALLNRAAPTSDRLIAAELASDITVINDELAETLLGVVRNADEPEKLRSTAALALGPVLELAYIDEFDDPDEAHISERTFKAIQSTLHQLYLAEANPPELRRRILEASVRASENWHVEAIAQAYSSGDKDWMLTAVFAIRWLRGFDDQILEALESPDAKIHYEAVHAAGNWELAAAWPHVAALVSDPATPKPLLLAAIDAAGNIRPKEAPQLLRKLAKSHDEEIAEAAEEAILMAKGRTDEDALENQDEQEEESSGWIN